MSVAGTDLYTNEAIAALEPKNPADLLDDYLFFLFSSGYISSTNIGKKAFGKSLNSDYLKYHVRVPVPTIDVQKDFVSKCKKIQQTYRTTRMTEADYKKQLLQLLKDMHILIL